MLSYLIVFTPLYITLFWAIVFLTNRFRINKARFWLGLFMLIASVLYICHAVFFLGSQSAYLKIDSLYLLVGLSVYPMYYFYVRLLTCDVSPRLTYIFHFLPAVFLSFILLFLSIIAPVEERQNYYQMVLILNRWPAVNTSFLLKLMAFVFFFSRIIFGIQVLVYLGLGYQLVRKYNERIANFYSNVEGKELLWIKLLTISFLLTSLVSMVANLLGRGHFLNNEWLLVIPSGLFSVLFFVIGLQGNKQDQVIQALENEVEEQDLSEVRYSETRMENLKRDLLSVLQQEKIYLNPDLRVTELCKVLRTNRTYLSRLIKESFSLSFNDFINQYRVAHARELILQDNQERFSQSFIAEQSGFGSLSSFNRAFKKELGVTPGEYKKTLRL